MNNPSWQKPEKGRAMKTKTETQKYRQAIQIVPTGRGVFQLENIRVHFASVDVPSSGVIKNARIQLTPEAREVLKKAGWDLGGKP